MTDTFSSQRNAETISAHLDLVDCLANANGAEARRNADTADYYRERRLKAIRRYLKERSTR